MSLSSQRTGHPQGMIVTLDTARLRAIEQVEAFMRGTAAVGFSPPPESERYAWIGRTLNQVCLSGVRPAPAWPTAPLHRVCDRLFPCAAQPPDCTASGLPSATGSTRPARRPLCHTLWRCRVTLPDRNRSCPRHLVRAYHQEARRTGCQGARPKCIRGLGRLSVSHLYNLRKSAGYMKARVHFTQTTAPRTPVSIGVRKRPDPQGRAGFLRLDRVHQDDHEGMKGVYYINVVDCVT